MDNKELLNLTPARGYYTVRPIKTSESSSKILQANTDEKAYSKGVIVGVGATTVEEGMEFKPEFKIGDTVWYSFSGFEEISEDGKSIRLIRFRAICAKANG